ncbi:unnamed protein product [Cuscuta epithymum]|uniref:Uncharacterized protein n=1 Tax=Cuscuta epithymum TaxID=186058 RepID=A0AAV0FKC2_9ASTE|nr:unnamed protein product [Cuscuta epithymum]
MVMLISSVSVSSIWLPCLIVFVFLSLYYRFGKPQAIDLHLQIYMFMNPPNLYLFCSSRVRYFLFAQQRNKLLIFCLVNYSKIEIFAQFIETWFRSWRQTE